MNWGLHKMAWRTRSIFHGALKLKARNASGEELRCVQTASKPCCAMKGHFVWEMDNFICNNVRGERHLSVRAHLLLPSRSMRFPPYRPPHHPLVRPDLECFLMSAPPRSQWDQEIARRLLHTVTLGCRHRAATQGSLESQKKERLFFFSAFHLDRNMTQLALPYRHRGPKKFLSLSA